MPTIDYGNEFYKYYSKADKDTILTGEILMTGNVELLEKFQRDNEKKLSPEAKRYLKGLTEANRYIRKLENSKASNKKKTPPTLEEVNGALLLSNMDMPQNQTSFNGCWSVTLEMLMKSRGVNVPQEIIRAFRSYDGSPEEMPKFGDGIVKDYNLDHADRITLRGADLLTRTLPNTGMRQRTYGIGEKYDPNDTKLSKQLTEDIRKAIEEKRSPVALWLNGHYRTVIGVNSDDQELIFKDSLGQNPNGDYACKTKDVIDFVRKVSAEHKEQDALKSNIVITWLEDIQPNSIRKGKGIANWYDENGQIKKIVSNTVFQMEEKEYIRTGEQETARYYQGNVKSSIDGVEIFEELVLPTKLTQLTAYKETQAPDIIHAKEIKRNSETPHIGTEIKIERKRKALSTIKEVPEEEDEETTKEKVEEQKLEEQPEPKEKLLTKEKVMEKYIMATEFYSTKVLGLEKAPNTLADIVKATKALQEDTLRKTPEYKLKKGDVEFHKWLKKPETIDSLKQIFNDKEMAIFISLSWSDIVKKMVKMQDKNLADYQSFFNRTKEIGDELNARAAFYKDTTNYLGISGDTLKSIAEKWDFHYTNDDERKNGFSVQTELFFKQMSIMGADPKLFPGSGSPAANKTAFIQQYLSDKEFASSEAVKSFTDELYNEHFDGFRGFFELDKNDEKYAAADEAVAAYFEEAIKTLPLLVAGTPAHSPEMDHILQFATSMNKEQGEKFKGVFENIQKRSGPEARKICQASLGRVVNFAKSNGDYYRSGSKYLNSLIYSDKQGAALKQTEREKCLSSLITTEIIKRGLKADAEFVKKNPDRSSYALPSVLLLSDSVKAIRERDGRQTAVRYGANQVLQLNVYRAASFKKFTQMGDGKILNMMLNEPAKMSRVVDGIMAEVEKSIDEREVKRINQLISSSKAYGDPIAEQREEVVEIEEPQEEVKQDASVEEQKVDSVEEIREESAPMPEEKKGEAVEEQPKVEEKVEEPKVELKDEQPESEEPKTEQPKTEEKKAEVKQEVKETENEQKAQTTEAQSKEEDAADELSEEELREKAEQKLTERALKEEIKRRKREDEELKKAEERREDEEAAFPRPTLTDYISNIFSYILTGKPNEAVQKWNAHVADESRRAEIREAEQKRRIEERKKPFKPEIDPDDIEAVVGEMKKKGPDLKSYQTGVTEETAAKVDTKLTDIQQKEMEAGKSVGQMEEQKNDNDPQSSREKKEKQEDELNEIFKKLKEINKNEELPKQMKENIIKLQRDAADARETMQQMIKKAGRDGMIDVGDNLPKYIAYEHVKNSIMNGKKPEEMFNKLKKADFAAKWQAITFGTNGIIHYAKGANDKGKYAEFLTPEGTKKLVDAVDKRIEDVKNVSGEEKPKKETVVETGKKEKTIKETLNSIKKPAGKPPLHKDSKVSEVKTGPAVNAL